MFVMTEKNQKSSKALVSLVSVLDLEVIDLNLFRGRTSEEGWQRVFGGQVLAQALVAAGRTIEEPRMAHSLHGYFLLAGNPSEPIIYEVERTRDGTSFSTRHVKAIQNSRIIFSMGASFHKEEEAFEHQSLKPDVPPPDKVLNTQEILSYFERQLPQSLQRYLQKERPIEIKPIDIDRYIHRKAANATQSLWMRANGILPDDPQLHRCVLAYASDYTLLDTALIPHGKLIFDDDVQLASLDHALWFHRFFRADEWLLYVQDSPSTHAARGFCRGSFFDIDGRLVASVAQEGLIRKRTSQFLIK